MCIKFHLVIPRTFRPTSPAAAAVIVKSNSKRSELYEPPPIAVNGGLDSRNLGTTFGRESVASSSMLTGFGTNSSLAGLGGLGNRESGKGYRVGTTEEFVFPGGVPRDRLDCRSL